MLTYAPEVGTEITTPGEAAPDRVWLDDGGLLHAGRAWVPLPDVEWRIVTALMSRMGEVVPRGDLFQAGWPGKEVKMGTLSVSIRRVRKRVRPLGLTVTTVRGRGFVMSTASPGSNRPGPDGR